MYSLLRVQSVFTRLDSTPALYRPLITLLASCSGILAAWAIAIAHRLPLPTLSIICCSSVVKFLIFVVLLPLSLSAFGRTVAGLLTDFLVRLTVLVGPGGVVSKLRVYVAINVHAFVCCEV